MIYSPSTTAALGIVEDAQPEEPLTLRGEGLWVCLVSSGKCVVSLSDLELMPAGSALLLPPQNAAAGHLVLSRGPLTLAPGRQRNSSLQGFPKCPSSPGARPARRRQS